MLVKIMERTLVKIFENICAEKTDFSKFYDKPARWDWQLTLGQFTVKGHNWFSFTYCDFNLYFIVTRLIHECKTTGWLQDHSNLSSIRDWSNKYQEFLGT